MTLQLLILTSRSFNIWVPVLFEIMVVIRRGLGLELMSFLWFCCFQYKVWLLCNSPGICLSFLDYRLVCRMLRLYSGRTGWRCPGLMVGVLSLGLGLGFPVVPKCCPRVERFQDLQLVQRLCSIRLVHFLHQKWVSVIWWHTMFPSSWYEWPTRLRLVQTSVVVDKRFWNNLFWLVSRWLNNLSAYSRCCGAIIF